ncbi:MAG: CoA transferase [Acidimicrobiales bacterium]
MRLEEVANAEAAGFGKPLDGVRILALEQMQALPYATQLLGRLGADVVKVESPRGGDSGRGSQPAIRDPEGRSVGATFLRNNFDKRSITIDLKQPEGRDLVLRLAPRFDVFAENFKAGALDRMGLGYADVVRVHPGAVYLSVSGFGNGASPYRDWPAYASVAEAMSGIYEFKREPGRPPVVSPVGGLADIASGLFGVVGILAALRARDRTGEGQHVDVAMFDAMVSMADLVMNFWSLGLQGGEVGAVIMSGFEAADGWYILQVGREHQFEVLARLVGRPEWLTDPRFASRQGWVDHLESDIRPALDVWASGLTKAEAARRLSAAGLAAGPCLHDREVVTDPHLEGRRMIVEMSRDDGVDQPVLVPGNPVKFSKVADGPDRRVPWLGEHTDAVLTEELGLGAAELADLRSGGVIG